MMTAIRRLFAGRPAPVTFKDVPPAPRDPEQERRIKEAHSDLVMEIMTVERRSWEIRQELAGNVLNIVAGEHS